MWAEASSGRQSEITQKGAQMMTKTSDDEESG